MFERHLSGRLAAYVDGELPVDRRAWATTHLAGCARCRAALDGFEFAARMVQRLPRVEAPAHIWAAIDTALDRAAATPASTAVRFSAWMPALRPALAAAALLLVAVGLVWWNRGAAPPSDSAEAVVRLTAPAGPGRMALGEWIETDTAARAQIKIGAIGTVDIEPNTRVQLVTARTGEHRLNLARGFISAVITAPPRFFFVDTPSSTVVDLGCAYTMQVDEAGVGVLRVTSGWAALEWDKVESLVPAGASAPTRPDLGPGTPAFDDATDRLRAALVAFDYAAGGRAALDTILAEARDRDTLTLWHLLSRVEERERPRVFDRMAQLTPLPQGVTRDQALALDPATLKLWREELAWTW